MQARARVRYLRMSPKKMRQVASLIKGRPVEEALNILNFTPKSAAHHMAKVLKAAAANAMASVGTAKLKAEDLSVSSVYVDQAPTAKRIQFRSMGRVYRIRKRFCHLTIEVEGEPEADEPKTRGQRKKKRIAVDKDDKPKTKKADKTAEKLKAEDASKANTKKEAELKADEKPVDDSLAEQAISEGKDEEKGKTAAESESADVTEENTENAETDDKKE